MACAKQTASLVRATIGGHRRLSVNVNGLSRITLSPNAAQARSLLNLARLTLPFFSGCENTTSPVVQYLKPAASNGGDWRARLTRCGISVGTSTQGGWVALRQRDRHSTPAMNGRLRAPLFGCVTKPPVVVVSNGNANIKIYRSTFITSNHSGTNTYALTSTISRCFANRVIGSFTHGGT